jgi:hypothetical protein
MKTYGLLLALISFQTSQPARAGSATWSASPTSGDWSVARNWTPNAVPNGLQDNATFGVSNRTYVSISEDISILGMIFDVGASAVQGTLKQGLVLTAISKHLGQSDLWHLRQPPRRRSPDRQREQFPSQLRNKRWQ